MPTGRRSSPPGPTWDLQRWGGAGQPLVAARLHAEPEPRRRLRRQRVRPLGLRSLVLAADDWTCDHGPIANPYFDACDPPVVRAAADPGRARSTPWAWKPSWTRRSSTAPPTRISTVEPKAYRFRILNAANDRFFNLQLYKADANADRCRHGTPRTAVSDGDAGRSRR